MTASLFHQAVHAFQNGDLANARQAAKRVLASQPKNFDALHLLGVINAIQGETREAVRLFRKALALNAGNAKLHANLAKSLTEIGKYEDALASYERAIRLGGASPEITMDRGTVLKNLGRHTEALASYDQALALNPDYAEAWTNKGNLLEELQRYEEAIACHDRAISLNPELPVAWSNKGIILDELERYDAALACYDRAICLSPDHPVAWCNRGVTLRNIRRYDEALASYERALGIRPDYAEVWTNRGLVLTDLKRYDEALACYAKAISIDPGHADANYNDGVCRLAICDFENGWRGYEWRWKSSRTPKRRFPGIPEWSGGKDCRFLLAWAEQGVGDQILYSTMVEELKEYAQKVAVTLDARLVPLFERSFSGIQFLPCDQITAPQMQEVDRQIPIGSLGRYLRKTVGDFARNRPGFLISDAEKTQGLRARIRKDSRLICGLSWISKNQKFGSAKSLSLPDLMPILSLNNLSFVDLQYGDTSLERANLKAATGIDIEHLDDIDNFKDIDGLASLIDACDFVITTSNTTVHLAGALGKKTFLMVPGSRGKHWYWHEGHDHSLWYPSVRIFKQAIDADWKSVIDEVSKELRTAQNHTPPPSQPSP